MKKYVLLILLILSSMLLHGCATNAATSQMTIIPTVPKKIKTHLY